MCYIHVCVCVLVQKAQGHTHVINLSYQKNGVASS